MAAHQLSKSESTSIEKTSIVRLFEDDLAQLGLSCDGASLGVTGVPVVDHEHHELKAGEEELRRLIQYVVERIRQGEDLIRSIYKPQIERQLQSFLHLPIEEATPFAQRRCCTLLNKPQLSRNQNEYNDSEYDGVRCRVPQHRIAILAYEKSRDPRRRHLDSTTHWLEAESELRAAYSSHYHDFNTFGSRR